VLRDVARLDIFGMLLMREGRSSLNAKIVFESEYGALIPEARCQFANRCGDRKTWAKAWCVVGLGNRS
jgi:hypothetical protein